MNQQPAKHVRRYGIVGAALTAILMTPLVLASPPPSLHVQAQSWVDVVPDKATLSARLWEQTPAVADLEATQSHALSEARERLETRASQLIEAMALLGIEKHAITAGSLNVYPHRELGPRHQNGQHDSLIRTRVERPFRIELSALEQLDSVLDALVAADVNTLDGVQFDVQDRAAATDEALTNALQKAHRKARLMASTLGAELSHVQRIEETQSPTFQPRMATMRAESDTLDGRSPNDYRPGTLRIDAGVSVEWVLTAPDAADHPDKAAKAQE